METFIFCSCAGCLIRYINTYKETNKIKISFIVLDLLVSAFIGFLIFKVLSDYNLSENQGLVLSTICGNLGSRSLYLLKRNLNSLLKP